MLHVPPKISTWARRFFENLPTWIVAEFKWPGLGFHRKKLRPRSSHLPRFCYIYHWKCNASFLDGCTTYLGYLLRYDFWIRVSVFSRRNRIIWNLLFGRSDLPLVHDALLYVIRSISSLYRIFTIYRQHLFTLFSLPTGRKARNRLSRFATTPNFTRFIVQVVFEIIRPCFDLKGNWARLQA